MDLFASANIYQNSGSLSLSILLLLLLLVAVAAVIVCPVCVHIELTHLSEETFMHLPQYALHSFYHIIRLSICFENFTKPYQHKQLIQRLIKMSVSSIVRLVSCLSKQTNKQTKNIDPETKQWSSVCAAVVFLLINRYLNGIVLIVCYNFGRSESRMQTESLMWTKWNLCRKYVGCLYPYAQNPCKSKWKLCGKKWFLLSTLSDSHLVCVCVCVWTVKLRKTIYCQWVCVLFLSSE